jgi:mRNA interferase RelE/StbE
MSYKVRFEKKALKNLTRIDSSQRIILLSWISRNLEDCENPRNQGKALTGKVKQYWRYRVGDYRIVVDIYDNELIVVIISLGHRKEIYKKI